ncbi:MAG: hypothetical protein KAI53_02250 [Candidatus Aenigmarchaeota archaeon]|nr:hypothetical protein [Candidatus Aenigmarchaeota archaeon]
MPLTPFHFGPALFFGLLLFRYIHLPTFLIANVIVDLEPLFVLFFDLNYPLHGIFHSFAGGFLLAIILSCVMIKLDKNVQKVAGIFKARQDFSKKSIFITSILGIYIHILFDAPLYTDIMPFYPFIFNPFYGLFTGSEIYLLCILLFFAGLVLYIYRLNQK